MLRLAGLPLLRAKSDRAKATPTSRDSDHYIQSRPTMLSMRVVNFTPARVPNILVNSITRARRFDLARYC